ncbi:MAG: peptide-methionine (S)-S-oxide reductase MsrA [Chitinophagales bacterium]|nr:peptide-methionine (S)-S-oxide reductase MsrA [Chitinophagales bacterium]MDW8418461.1 peptide-methionine (S)-S-oxide reductase MsrA [Chitinophagales bacterium]
MRRAIIFLFATWVWCSGCAQKPSGARHTLKKDDMTDTIVLGGGCFWCTEAVFQRLRGVVRVVSGYSGGHVKNPTYKEVCTGETGHAECVQVEYDPEQISLREILEVFFHTHDPTTLNRQGNDVGTQYRSVIFYATEEQKKTAEQMIEALNASGEFDAPIVTTLEPFTVFYKAEDYHQNYFNLNKNSNPYCTYVIAPKLDKYEKNFAERLKK